MDDWEIVKNYSVQQFQEEIGSSDSDEHIEAISEEVADQILSKPYNEMEIVEYLEVVDPLSIVVEQHAKPIIIWTRCLEYITSPINMQHIVLGLIIVKTTIDLYKYKKELFA